MMNKIKSRILWVLITILLCLCFVFFGMSKVNAASSESAAYDIYIPIPTKLSVTTDIPYKIIQINYSLQR